jgi:hypothetical protein
LLLVGGVILIGFTSPLIGQAQTNSTSENTTNSTAPPATMTVTDTAPVDNVRETQDEFQTIFGDISGTDTLIDILSGIALGFTIIFLIAGTLYFISPRGRQRLEQVINTRSKVKYINQQLHLAGFAEQIGIFGKQYEIYPGVTMVIGTDQIDFQLPKINDPRYFAFIVKKSKVTTSVSIERLGNKLQVIRLYLDQETKS